MARYQFKRAENNDNPKKVGAFIDAARANDASKSNVVKIVIGPSPGGSTEGWDLQSLARLSDVEWASFPSLTHLYIWSIAALASLKPLPARLQCLDVRGCTGLGELPALPGKLEALVTDGCSLLRNAGTADLDLRWLVDLSMRDCPAIAGAFVSQVIRKAPNLRHLDISGSRVRSPLPPLPSQIEVVRMRNCIALDHEDRPCDLCLADQKPWPSHLRRLDLAQTTVTKLPPLSVALDHVDLSSLSGKGLGGTRLWPQQDGLPRPRPRTLFLHGSGLLVPPVSEQGVDASDNVALRFRAFHEAIDLVGRAESRRCKILLVGNGNAGKTTLDHVLRGQDPDHKLGTTHGIRFSAYSADSDPTTRRMVWDFGGQEIYHNAHRIFIQAGTVFVVVWNPLAEPTATAGVNSQYEDVRRPLRYWVDMIHLRCPNARIAVVCNPFDDKQPKPEGAEPIASETVDRYKAEARRQLGSALDRVSFYVCNLRHKHKVAEVMGWLDGAVSDVVRTQGTEVPTHWKIAEQMVESWLESGTRPEVISTAEFSAALATKIAAACADQTKEEYAKLRQARTNGKFQLGTDPEDKTLRYLLDFLSHVGLLYWNPAALNDQVIIDQKWFLDGVYDVLQRPQTAEDVNEVFDELTRDPVFNAERLATLVWQKPTGKREYTPQQQELMLAFMERMGLCFKLVDARQAWTGVATYVSVQHLRKDAVAQVSVEFDSKFSDARSYSRAPKRIDTLHVGLWEGALAWLGGIFGRDGHYAEDVVVVERDRENRAILVRCSIDPDGVGGTIEVKVGSRGPRDLKAEREWCERLAADLEKLCSQLTTSADRKAVESGSEIRTSASEDPKVFLSYAWNPRNVEQRTSLFPDSEDVSVEELVQPVIDLYEELERRVPSLCLFDRAHHDPRQHLEGFLNRARDVDLFVICHSNRYWRRPFCMYEAVSALRACNFGNDRPKAAKVFAFIGFGDCQCLDLDAVRKEHADWWHAGRAPISSVLADSMAAVNLTAAAEDFLRNDIGRLAGVEGNVCTLKLGRAGASEIADWLLNVRLPATIGKKERPEGDRAPRD